MFKVGDIVRGLSNEYTITNERMTKGEVIRILDRDNMKVRVMEHMNSEYVNGEHDVRMELFELVRGSSDDEFKVGDVVAISASSLRYSKFTEFYKRYKTEDTKHYVEELTDRIYNGMMCKIIAIEKHFTNSNTLALVNMEDMNCSTIINIRGLTKNLYYDKVQMTRVGDMIEYAGDIYTVITNKGGYIHCKRECDGYIKEISNGRQFTKVNHRDIYMIGDYLLDKNDKLWVITNFDSDGDYIVCDSNFNNSKYLKEIELDKMKVVNIKTYEEELLHNAIHNMLDDTVLKIKNNKSQIIELNSEITGLWKEISNKKTKILNMEKDLKILLSVDTNEVKEKTREMVKNVLEIPHIKELKVSEKDNLKIITDRIDFYDLKGNKFRGNEYSIELHMTTGALKFHPIGEKELHLSLWDEDNEISPHPHIGEPDRYCLGNAGDLLCEYLSEKNIFNAILVVISFLEQCNEEDSAGRWVEEWVCIDEDGDEIENPYDKRERCYECSEALEEGNEFNCNCCGNVCCDEHSRWIESEQVYVCESCLDDNYTICSVCNEYIKNYDTNTCDECGRSVCNSCEVTTDNNIYCSDDCRDSQNFFCEECGEYKENCDKVMCNECGEGVCCNCAEEEYDNNFCNNECLENWKSDNITTCDECGKEVHVDDVIEEDDLKFCSQSCHQIYLESSVLDNNNNTEEDEDEDTSDEE